MMSPPSSFRDARDSLERTEAKRERVTLREIVVAIIIGVLGSCAVIYIARTEWAASDICNDPPPRFVGCR